MLRTPTPRSRVVSSWNDSSPLMAGHLENGVGECSRRLLRHETLPQRFERRAEIRHENLRLLPRGEVAALVRLFVIEQFRIRLLGPAPRRLIELVGKGTH